MLLFSLTFTPKNLSGGWWRHVTWRWAPDALLRGDTTAIPGPRPQPNAKKTPVGSLDLRWTLLTTSNKLLRRLETSEKDELGCAQTRASEKDELGCAQTRASPLKPRGPGAVLIGLRGRAAQNSLQLSQGLMTSSNLAEGFVAFTSSSDEFRLSLRNEAHHVCCPGFFFSIFIFSILHSLSPVCSLSPILRGV